MSRASIQSKTLNLRPQPDPDQPFFPCCVFFLIDRLRFSCVTLLTTMASQNEDIKAIVEIMEGMPNPAAKRTFYNFLCKVSASLTSSKSETKPGTLRKTARGFTANIGSLKKPQKHNSKPFIVFLGNQPKSDPDPIAELVKFVYPIVYMSGNRVRHGGVAPWGILDETSGWRRAGMNWHSHF
ncbi:hypothetical protein B0H11DRAFT_2085182 [Mycena galericulata]|nr:hypothetical protein B0H11DRAFT_2085182 [Mycena galericulata]